MSESSDVPYWIDIPSSPITLMNDIKPSIEGEDEVRKDDRILRKMKRHSRRQRQLKAQLTEIQKQLTAMELSRQIHERRAAIRQDMIFTAIKKMSEELTGLNRQYRAANGIAEDNNASPSRERQNGRKTLKHCLAMFLQQLESAKNMGELEEAGKLCVVYTEDLFKTYI